MPLTRETRSLSAPERRLLASKLASQRARRQGAILRSFGVSATVGGVLCVLTLLASTAPRLAILGFWIAAAGGLGLWVGAESRSVWAFKIGRLESALRASRAEAIRISAPQYLEFEEVSDEGACYAFEVAENEVVFVAGQDFYPSARFPNSDFTLVKLLTESGEVVDEIIVKSGEKIAPVRVLPRARKAVLRIPAHLSLVPCGLSGLEDFLAA